MANINSRMAGIYVGGNKVIHFMREPSTGSSGESSLSSFSSSSGVVLNISSLSFKAPSTCPNFPDCGFQQPESGVALSCVECFLGNGSLYRFEYEVTPLAFLIKLRGGTCTTAGSDPPRAVIHRAMYLLQNGFGNYDVFKNNCEDFAIYCKTGLLILDQSALGRSGQASCVIGAPLAAILSSPLKLFMSSPVGVATATAGIYCMSRYATDIGVRTDTVKVKVEDISLYHGCDSPKKKLDEDNKLFEGQLRLNQTEGSAAKRQRCR